MEGILWSIPHILCSIPHLVLYTTYFFLPYNAVVFLFVQNSCCYMSCVLYSKSISISFVYVFIDSIVGNVKVSNKKMFISWEM